MLPVPVQKEANPGRGAPSRLVWLCRGVSRYGVVLLSRYPLEAPQIHRLTGGREPRLLLTAQLRLPDRTVTVATTHLSVELKDEGANGRSCLLRCGSGRRL
ncbi:hypothetical protein QJ48_13400 [Paenibacillus sp. A3]|nr:hypothetical protein QJ48_13400 [Paenibacillus sp. A3]